MVAVCGFKSIHHPQMLYGILNNANFPSERHVEKWFILLVHTSQTSVLLGYDADILSQRSTLSLCVTRCSTVHMA